MGIILGLSFVSFFAFPAHLLFPQLYQTGGCVTTTQRESARPILATLAVLAQCAEQDVI